MKRNLLLFFLSALTLTTAAITRAEDGVSIGALLPLTGQLAPFGEIVRRGITSAKAKSTTIIFEDDQCLPEKSISAYKHLSSVKKTNLFLGPCCTSAVAAVAPLIKQNKQLAMNFCTGSEEIFERSGGTIFHAQYSAQAEGAFNAQAMWDLGIKKTLIVYQDSEFGRAHEAAFRTKYPGAVVSTLVYSAADREQLKSLILKMRSLDFDAVYVPLVETFLLGFMTEMKKAGFQDKRAFGIYSVQLPDVLEAEGKNSEGIIYSYPEIPTTENAAVYFAKLAAEMLDAEVAKCGVDVECIRTNLRKDYRFDDHNFLMSKLFLKTIRDGQFVDYKGSYHNQKL